MTTSIQSRLGRAPEEGIKAPVICATTANITLSGTGQTIDGVVTANGDRVLVKDQTAPAENGIYLVSANAWERASDMNKDDDVAQAQMVADSNRSILYQVNVTSPWTPGSTSITFTSFLSAMPPMITLTLSDPVDLVDVSVPLVIGAVDPATAQHLEFDFQSVQSKSNATTASALFLNPLGGPINLALTGVLTTILGTFQVVEGATFNAQVLIESAFPRLTMNETDATADNQRWDFVVGADQFRARVVDDADTTATNWITVDRTLNVVDVINLQGTALQHNGTQVSVVGHTHVEADITDLQAYALASALTAHTGDATIHFTQAAISITASQISDFASAVAANAAVAANTAKVSNVSTALSTGTVTGTTYGITSDGGADDVVLPVFNSTDSGLVPGSGGGTTNFLRADGSFAAPPGGLIVGLPSYVQDGEVQTGTNTVPADDTIPQITEGDEYMTLVHTPDNAANILVIDVVFQAAHTGIGVAKTTSLFMNAVADALATAYDTTPSANGSNTQAFRHRMVAGTVSAITFRVRCGGSSAGTLTFNGFSGGRIDGGVRASSITVTEYLP